MGIFAWFKGLASIRNLAIVGGILAAYVGFLHVQIGWKNHSIKSKNEQIARLDFKLDAKIEELRQAIDANESNVVTIDLQNKEIQQCVYKRELNETTATAVLQTSEKRIVDLKSKYEKLRNELPKMGTCVTPTVSDAVIASLYAARPDKD